MFFSFNRAGSSKNADEERLVVSSASTDNSVTGSVLGIICIGPQKGQGERGEEGCVKFGTWRGGVLARDPAGAAGASAWPPAELDTAPGLLVKLC